MKKSVFALLSLASLAVASMSSCSNDNSNSVTPDDNPDKSTNVKFVVMATAQQQNYFDQTYTLNINGTSKTVKLSQMTPVDTTQYANTAMFKTIKSNYNNVTVATPFKDAIKIYTYDLGSMSSGNLTSSATFAVKDNHPSDAFDYYLASGFFTSDASSMSMTQQKAEVFTGLGYKFDSEESLAALASHAASLQNVTYVFQNK